MADDAAKSGDKKEGGMKQLIMALVAVTVLGLGAGYGLGMFVLPDPAAETAATDAGKAKDAAKPAADAHAAKPAGEAKAEGHGETPAEGDAQSADAEEEPEEEPVNLAELVTTPFPPVITSIGKPQTVWIRLEGSVLSRKESETKPDLLAARAAQQILAYLRTLSLDELQGANGMFHINEDLNEIMVNFSNGDVRAVLINGLIVE